MVAQVAEVGVPLGAGEVAAGELAGGVGEVLGVDVPDGDAVGDVLVATALPSGGASPETNGASVAMGSPSRVRVATS